MRVLPPDAVKAVTSSTLYGIGPPETSARRRAPARHARASTGGARWPAGTPRRRLNEIDRVESRCDPDNVRSAAVPSKLGFVHEATLRQEYRLSAGSYRDTMVWSMLHPDFYNSPAASYRVAAFDAVGARLS